jgi:hypothetical protein
MTSDGFLDFVLYKLLSICLQFVALFILILFCEWYAEKKGFSLLERAWLISLLTFPIVTLILWTIIIARFKLF